MEFSKKLRELRLKNNLTQAQLAKKAGTTSAAISHFEAGIRKPTVGILKKLAHTLGVSVDELIGLKEQIGQEYLEFRELTRELNEKEIREIKEFIEYIRFKKKKDKQS